MTANKHFFILEDPVKSELGSDSDQLQIITLRNPATGKASKYLLRDGGKLLYELNCFNEPKRSWFMDESVCSNGKIYIPTRMDPLFLIIPYLEKNCTGKAVPLEHILADNEFPHSEKLTSTVQEGQLAMVADEKKAGNFRAYKYNEEKVLDWLSRKCHLLEKSLAKTTKYSQSHNFVKEEKENDPQDQLQAGEMIHYAHGVLSDYLSLDLSGKLSKTLGIPEEKTGGNNKRKSTAEIEISQIKKVKKEEIHETTPIKAVEKKVSAKSKALAKAATNTKSIASFFKK
ncbi:ribonuclease H2 subunit B [Uranotaenia lowii]|uniref:ribonuclease H2 subunit B n=1 Tax=Uranotaenia lowii TaxID=190385 RepID=UPI002479F3AD|nr:ribonuclease H2 subunit B [Uranotaenia lowii]